MNSHLTTDPASGVRAGIWHDLPDGTPRYFTVAHVAHMARLRGKADTSSAAIDEIKANRRGASFSRGTKSGTCVVCEQPFTNGQPDQVTCGGEACKREQQKRRADKSYRKEAA